MWRSLTILLVMTSFGLFNLAQADRMPERQISQGSDDAEEDIIPSTVVENGPLWACCACPAAKDTCHITGTGLRFIDVQIPQGATIDSAWLTIMPFIITNDDIACTVYCENVDNCTTFVTAGHHDISNRTRTAGKVIWYQRNAGENWMNSCNLAEMVQEVVNRPGWSSGNALAFILIPGDSAGQWYDNLQLQAWELMDHSWGAKFNCVYTASDVSEESAAQPEDFTLWQNQPNPFNQSTEIQFSLQHSGFVSLDVFDLLGRRVRTLVTQSLPAGHRSVQWDGKNDFGKEVGSGVYFYRMKVGGITQTKKLVLLK
jgi:hypothetical protein